MPPRRHELRKIGGKSRRDFAPSVKTDGGRKSDLAAGRHAAAVAERRTGVEAALQSDEGVVSAALGALRPLRLGAEIGTTTGAGGTLLRFVPPREVLQGRGGARVPRGGQRRLGFSGGCLIDSERRAWNQQGKGQEKKHRFFHGIPPSRQFCLPPAIHRGMIYPP